LFAGFAQKNVFSATSTKCQLPAGLFATGKLHSGPLLGAFLNPFVKLLSSIISIACANENTEIIEICRIILIKMLKVLIPDITNS
jgi:hypothetical protein